MTYLPTSQAYLEQSALLLQAYPETTRITTKYHFPQSSKPAAASQPATTPASTTSTPAAPVASLTLKTFNPSSGICLKYRTNKAAEVGRLITSLGKLAAGADVASLGLSGAAPAPVAAGPADVEMVDASEETSAAPAPAAASTTTTTNASGKGGKSKKKGGKGKR